MTLPLDGFRVLDLSSVVLGPLATQVLGDLGAEVIKIEAPGGDTTRSTGPQRSPGMAALFMGVNRNKRSAVLDLKQAAARDALWRLIDGADVFLHSIRPQKLDRLGFGQESVRRRNPRIVYAGLHGYRTDGPYGGRPAYDDVIQGRSGSADLMARLVGEPRYMPTIMADKTCALVAAYAVVAALLARERTGRGQFVEIPMFETMAAFNLTEHIYGRVFDPAAAEMGYPRVLVQWRRPYPTADGYICMLAYTDEQWRRFWREVGRAELIDDPRFDDAQEPERQYRRGLPHRRGMPARARQRRMGGGAGPPRNPRRPGDHAGRADGGRASRRGRVLSPPRPPQRGRGGADRPAGPVLRGRGGDPPAAAQAGRAFGGGAGGGGAGRGRDRRPVRRRRLDRRARRGGLR